MNAIAIVFFACILFANLALGIQFREWATKDTRCGPTYNNTFCLDGSCCSADSVCGYSSKACGKGCQPGYGSCDIVEGARVLPNIPVSSTRQCGINSPLQSQCPPGQCCSSFNYCGNDPAYCGAGCQTGFGACYDSETAIKAMNMTPPFPIAKVPVEATVAYSAPFRSGALSKGFYSSGFLDSFVVGMFLSLISFAFVS